ncbi:PREDICTED: uncharacterized protein LOC109475470 isoform X1 [Branchiostoma belcheri]|uniref:Uncharacterized protein LOC109475470 isoform X1 n=2 Tax=Branchiostoma belcheri TaxID=7741 RepID=A0A6P4ZPQ8_BRABE|nr:PREDICTED: uncharacterized protein LOC109475470 isoform X1 [Branchiostoma belcheri]
MKTCGQDKMITAIDMRPCCVLTLLAFFVLVHTNQLTASVIRRYDDDVYDFDGDVEPLLTLLGQQEDKVYNGLARELLDNIEARQDNRFSSNYEDMLEPMAMRVRRKCESGTCVQMHLADRLRLGLGHGMFTNTGPESPGRKKRSLGASRRL